MNAYADAGLTAAEVTDTLVAAVREGRAEPESSPVRSVASCPSPPRRA